MKKTMSQLYATSEDFKLYVDKYCTKSNKSVEEALKDAVVREYADYLLQCD